MNTDKFKQDLITQELKSVYKKHMLGSNIWYFEMNFKEDSYKKYDEFKVYISDRLGVHINDIAIMGSGKNGFSTNPSKNFKMFNEKSDIDIVIVSQRIFNEFWEEYLKEHNSLIGIRDGKYRFVASAIFRKFVTLEGFENSNNTYYKYWQKKTGDFEKDLQLFFKINNDIHYRIYESWDAVEAYYVKGLLDLREKIK